MVTADLPLKGPEHLVPDGQPRFRWAPGHGQHS